MKTFLAMLIVIFLGMAPTKAQVPTPSGMWKPKPHSVLYETLIKYGTHREDRFARIWTDDQQTVYIQTIIEGRIFRYIATDNGLETVLSCEFLDRNKRQMPPKKVVLCDFIEVASSENDEFCKIDGRPAIKVRVELVPRWSEEGQDIIEGFNFLVRMFELKEEAFH